MIIKNWLNQKIPKLIMAVILLSITLMPNRTAGAEMPSVTPTEYLMELARFGIKNNGTSPQETSAGLNQALQYAKEQGFSKIIIPKGTYLIHETDPVVIDLKNTVIDLNGSTLQINTNGLEKYSVIEFRDGAENVRLTNGTIRGDRDTHDYQTLKSGHEWGCGLVLKNGLNLQFDNLKVTNFIGYGIVIGSDTDNNAHRYYQLNPMDVAQGSISDDGTPVPSTTKTRTKAYDMSVCGGKFELGYTLGYLGYPYLKNGEYTAYFYDENMNFVEKKECVQYRKVDIPKAAKYARFVYPQASIVSNTGFYGWITNLKPPTASKITDCLIENNRCLGLAVCGGQQMVIENNIFEGNGGALANHAVDFEDGFELIQDYMFRNNKFKNNAHDLTVAAGDNLVFEGNEFTTTLWIWERTTNYKVIGNKFTGSSSSSAIYGGAATYRIKKTGCEVRDNRYLNCSVNTASFSPLMITLTNETLTDSQINANPAAGTGCKIVNSTIKSTKKPFMTNATIENSDIEAASAEVFNLKLKNCRIKNSNWNLHYEQFFENCEIVNCVFPTHINTAKIQFKNSKILNSQVFYAAWGSAAETVFEGCKVNMNTGRPLVRLSAGKTRKLMLKNNIIVNQTAKPVIELYDTTYTVPNGTAVLEGNSFTQTGHGYVFDGVKITKGIFNFADRKNTVTGAKMLNPRYLNNKFFKYKR